MTIHVSVIFESEVVPGGNNDEWTLVRFFDSDTKTSISVPMDLFGEVVAAIFTPVEEGVEPPAGDGEDPFDHLRTVPADGSGTSRSLRAARADG